MLNELNQWDTKHRPWPIPNIPWVMHQSWNNLLFMHYPISLKKLRDLVPKSLPIDTYDGWGWISVVPFRMDNIKVRGLPLSISFPELNVRTYVNVDNKPGVYFFSLDATNLPFVLFSKTFCHLPYMHSNMTIKENDDYTSFICNRMANTEVQLKCNYRAISEPYAAPPDSLDYWLTERYCFYTTNRAGKVIRCNILHKPWPIQKAEVEIVQNTMLTAQSLFVENESPILHYSKGVDVRIWPLLRVE